MKYEVLGKSLPNTSYSSVSEQRLSVRRTCAWSACRARLTSTFTKWILRILTMKFTHTKSKLAMMKKQRSKPKIHAKCVTSAFSVSMEWKSFYDIKIFYFYICVIYRQSFLSLSLTKAIVVLLTSILSLYSPHLSHNKMIYHLFGLVIFVG